MLPVVLRLVLAVLAALVLAAHFLRAGHLVLVPACLALVGLLFVRRPWAARTVQIALGVGGIEWLFTLYRSTLQRLHAGDPYLRMVLILGAVAALTFYAAYSFNSAALRDHYRQR